MKARIPAKNRLTNAQSQAVREYNDEQQEEAFRRWLKLACVALHSSSGFGHDRCADFLAEVTRLANIENQDEIFWLHIDQILKKELKLDFKPEKFEI